MKKIRCFITWNIVAVMVPRVNSLPTRLWRVSGTVWHPGQWPLTSVQADRRVNSPSVGGRREAARGRLTGPLHASFTDSRYCFLVLSWTPTVNGTRQSFGHQRCTLPRGRLGVVMSQDVTMPMSGPATVAADPVPHLHGEPVPGRCLVVGVVSVTPDSFSDAGKSFHPEQAIGRGMELMRLGADIIDVGGESTRPGAARVPLAEEQRRVLPVVTALAGAGAFVSIATVRARAAEAAIQAGAGMVTDMSGGLADPAMLPLVAGYKVPYVVMHWWGHGTAAVPRVADRAVVADVMAGLTRRIAAATAAGIAFEQLIVDPGLGFARTDEHNRQLLAHLAAFHQLGRPVLVGPARPERPGGKRNGVSAAVAVLAAAAGAWGVRAHDAETALDAVRVVAAVAIGRVAGKSPVHIE